MAAPLSISNPHPQQLPGPQLLHHLVPRQGKDGIAAAIEHTDADGSISSLTYDEFHARSDALAARIRAALSNSPSRSGHLIVPVLVPQSPHLYIAQLAILKAGGAFCPIVLDAPEERLRFILQDVSARVLLTTGNLKPKLPDLEGVEVLAVDHDHSQSELPAVNVSITAKDAAYIMYTSGSTGQPKGVVLSHSAATQALLAHDLHIPTFSRFLQFASPTFDVSVFEIFFPWLRGCTLVSCDRRRLLNDLPAAINSLNVDACELTPSVASSLLRGRESVPSLKVLLTIGEMLKPSVVEAFGGSAHEPAILHGMYGPTEATIHCTLQTYFPKDMSCGSIGEPLDTVSAFVVKAQDPDAPLTIEIVPQGEEGELAVGGHQLADGYLNREEQTRAAFVSHPHYGMLYRTGDRAKMLPNGRFECLGRISSGQVKLRGQRIELGEIEHAASRTPGCRDVVAEVISGILVVFCVREEASVTEVLVMETCQKWLPAFMVPGDVVMLETLPYLASGKCDRRALRSRYEESQRSGEADEQILDEQTAHVISILRDVLKVEVNAHSLLPGLGLDSLSSIRIASAFRRQGLQQLDAGQILSSRTPVDLVTSLKAAGNAPLTTDWAVQAETTYRASLDKAVSRALPARVLPEVEESFPCTPVQIAMLTETEKDAGAYCNWLEFDVPGCSDPLALESALHSLSKIHPMTRSGFVALTRNRWSYAVVVWSTMSPLQIKQTSAFDKSFRLEDESHLLRPCSFQILRADAGCRLLMLVHHALYDQWAIDAFRADLSAILRGASPPPHTSFKSVADFYVHHDDESNSAAAVEFWQDHLRDVPPTSLPLLRGSEAGSCLQRTRWRETSLQSDAVKAKSRELGCSSPAIFQAAMAYILALYSGVSDVTVGTVFSGRTLPVPDIDGVFGPCLATLPFRIDHSTVATCRDFALAVTQRNRAMQNHVMTSPTVIRQSAGVAPGVSLFDSLFVWQETTLHADTSPSTIHVVDSEDHLEFNLVLEFEPSSTAINVRATYQQSILAGDQVEMFISQVVSIATHIVEHPECLVENLAACLAPDMLSISNPHPAEFSSTFELTDVIARRAINSPSATAILFAESLVDGEQPSTQSITYAELDARANQMAHAFIASGLRAEGLVCICMEKCIDLYVAMLASFKAGAGYLPLVPETPTARIKSVLAQVDVDLCVCDAGTTQIFQNLSDATILDLTALDLSVSSPISPATVQNGSRISYAVFTSGSTGEPKGVAVTMDNLKGNLAVLGELYQVRPGQRLLQACSQAFDVSVFEIFFAFYSGMCLCSATKDVIFRDFEHSIRAFGATHLSLTPTVAALVDPKNVPSVQFLVTAGEGITEKVHRRWAGRGLHQGYGPSETTNICSVKMNHAPTDVLGNIGPPFKNTSAFVLSPEGDFRVLPTGAYGEYAFGGEQVFRGYVGREDLNSTKIITHPEYGRVYRSGDMGRILPDGTLLIAGRLDDQVKIRGNRVELGEINAVISDHSGVADCTTLVLGEGSSQQTLASFWVPASRSPASTAAVSVERSGSRLVAEIFDRLEDALPTYMIPSILVPLSRLPMTTQGKLDKRLLRSTFEALDGKVKDQCSRSHDVSNMDGPASPMEHAMANTLSAVLQIPATSISRNSSFFALGLNSLNAIQFARSLERELNTHLSVTAILRHSSIARLGRVLSQSADTDGSDDHVNIREVLIGDFAEDIRSSFAGQGHSVEAILPCTPLQQAMLSASGAAYCNTTKLSLSGDMQKLQNCWYEMVRRHAILRTSFVETPLAAHPFAQVVLRNPPLPWYSSTSRRRLLENGHANGCTNGYTNGESNSHSTAHTPADTDVRSKATQVTASSPIRIDEDGSDIYLHMHHALYDGISVSNLFSEIQRLYNGETLPPPPSFEPFLEKVVAQNGNAAIDFWSSRMHDFQPHPFPVRDETDSIAEKIFTISFPLHPSELKMFSERHSCTSLIVLQAAWVKTLACAQAITDVCFGNVVSGRSVAVPDVDHLVAPCFNTIPLRTDLDKAHTNLDLIRDLQRSNVDTLAFQLTAPRKIQTLTQDPSLRLFDSVLLVQPPRTDDAGFWTVAEESMDMGIPLVLEISPESDSFELQIHYLPRKVPEALIPVLANAYVSSLTSCIRYSSSPVGHFMDFDDLSRIAGALAPSPPTAAESGGSSNGSSDGDWTSEERLVRQVFSDLSGVALSRIAKQTSLYQIGLDSLNAVQVASTLRKHGVRLDTADVLQLQNASGLAGFITSNRDSSVHDMTASVKIDLAGFDVEHRHLLDSLHVDADRVEGLRPCTPAQSGMLAQFIQSQGGFYLNHSAYEIPPEYSLEQVRAAWVATLHKHQLLRTGFVQLEDAATPFAMLVYKASTVPEEEMFSSAANGSALRDIERDATQSILHSLHLPAWRVSLVPSAGKRTMCLTLHHSLYDADSLRVIHNDFLRAARGIDLGRPADFDRVLVEQLEGYRQLKQERERFWTMALQSARYVKFPNLTPTNVVQGAAHSIEISSRIETSSLETFCRREGVTVQALGQSVWATLLSAYLGEPDVTFGTVFSGIMSTDSSTAAVVFPTISTVPVYCNTSKPTAEILKDMVSYNASAQRYRFAPLSDIQRYAGSAGQALFDTIFVYQKSHAESDGHHFDWESLSDSLGIDYTVSMEMEAPTPGRVCLRLTYDTATIPDEQASLLLKQFDMLLLNRTLSEESSPRPTLNKYKYSSSSSLMSIVPPKERTLPCTVELLHQLLERGAVQHPHRPALEFIHTLDGGGDKGRKRWTYRELNHRCNQVAHLIQRCGVKAGGVVAVCMSKSAEATFAFAGILKAGCAFLAMDPDLPLARRKFIIEDSRSALLFVDRGKLDAEMQEVVHNVVELEESMLVDLPTSDVSIAAAIDPRSSTSYILYTSGTTGTPKGCELTHENAVQAMMAFQRLFAGHWTESSRWLQFASYWFDVSVLEQFWSWSVGITVVGAPRDVVLEDLAGFIREANITHIDLTPSLARLLTPEDVPSLWNHVFITGGESLKQEIIDRWGPLHTIYNGYGPTEATIGVTMNPHIGADAKPSNIGPPFDNVGAFVLAPETDEPVMRGAVGELCVSGKLVGKGYLNRPDLTAKMFPYLERHRERVYRTGDLVRLLADGSISFIGRKDTQAKLRGQRLEIDEIDAVIKAATDEIADVASLVVKSADGHRESLASFIVDRAAALRSRDDVHIAAPPSSRTQLLVATADRACRDRLPGYMVPTHIIPISRLPLTVNNKVDTKKLVSLFESMSGQDLQRLRGHDAAGEGRAMRPVEQKIAKTLGRLLSVEESEITANSNVFSLGLSSVSALNFATMLKRSGFDNAGVATIMKHSTVDQLAKALTDGTDERQGEGNMIKQAQLTISAFAHRYRSVVARSMSIDVSDIEALAPCTPLQEGLLVESLKKTTAERPYFNDFCYQVGRCDLPRLEVAVGRLYRSIPMLRTSFVRTDEGFCQAVIRDRQCPFESLGAEDDDGVVAVARHKKTQWVARADQEVLEPLQFVVVRGPTKTILVLHAHHAMYDGISWDLMMERLRGLYESDANIDVDDCGFIDALAYGPLVHHPDGKSFWQTRLANTHFHPLDIKSDNGEGGKGKGGGGGSGDVGSGTTEAVPAPIITVPLSNSHELERVRKQLGVSHQALLQAAFAVALHQMAPQTQTYGVVLSGRSIPLDRADTVIGPMFNTVPNVVDVQSSESWSHYLQRCHDSNAALLPFFQHTSLREIRRFCQRSPSDPLFDVLFVFQRPEAEAGSPESSSAEEEALFEPMMMMIDTPADYPLAFEVELGVSGDISFTIVSQPQYAGTGALLALARAFQAAIDCIVDDVTQNISAKFTIETRVVNGVVVVDSENGRPTPPTQQQQPSETSKDDFVWTAEAKIIRDTIAQVLGCGPDSSISSSITEKSSIYSLGLDSIDAVKLSSRLKRAGVPIPVSKILKAQTIANMMQYVVESLEMGEKSTPEEQGEGEGQGQGQGQGRRLPALERQLLQSMGNEMGNSVERILPAAPGQEALIADMIRSDFKDYYNSDILKLRKDVDAEKLRAAWQAVVDAMPILRTSFAPVEDADIDAVFAQVVHRPEALHFGELTAPSLEHLLTGNYLELVREDVVSSFTIKSPLRLALATVVGGDKYLILSLAHAQYDGHSLGLIHQDVAKAYHDGALETRPLYDDAIELALNATSPEALAFWRSNLTGAKASLFANSSPVSSSSSSSSTTHRGERISSVKASTARQACQKLGISMQVLPQASWAILLSHYVRELDVMFGVVLACRDSEDAEKVMFPTMNTVPVRVALHGTGEQMLLHLQSVINDMRPYQRTPLRAVQAACNSVVRSSSSSSSSDANNNAALFDTLFIYQQQHRGAESASGGVSGGDALYESVDGSSNVEYPVAVEVEVMDDNLIIRAACKNSLDGPGTEELLRRFDFVLDCLVSSPEDPIADFSRQDQVSVCGLPSFSIAQLPFVSSGGGGAETTTTIHDEENEKGEGEEEEDAGTSSLTETIILQTLSQVSRIPVDEISPTTTTMESLGIDSISAIKVTALLRKQGMKISVSDLLKAQTSRRITEKVVEQSSSSSASSVVASRRRPAHDVIAGYLEHMMMDLPLVVDSSGVDSRNVERILPAAAGQLYMLAMWQKSGGELFYPTFKYHVETTAGLEEIHAAWKEVVSRNAILRTVFCASGHADMPLLQLVLKTAPESFFVVNDDDMTNDPTPTQPLVRMAVVAASKSEDRGFDLELRIQHSLYDAVSISRLMEDFQNSISNRSWNPPSTTPPPPPPPPVVSFDDYLALSLASPNLQSRRSFWQQYLKDARPLHLFRSKRRGGGEEERRETVVRKVQIFQPAAFSSCTELQRFARTAQVTVQALLFAAYAKVYAAHASSSSQEGREEEDQVDNNTGDVIFGIYIANRSHLPDLQQLAAPTLNLLPLRVSSSSPIMQHQSTTTTSSSSSLVETAKRIDKDLRSITSVENSAASLAEIYNWTGVHVDSFVNFLRLPEQDEEDGNSQIQNSVAGDGAKITETNDEWKDARSHVQELPSLLSSSNDDTDTLSMPKELQSFDAGPAYQHSLDLELSILPNGNLNLGLFCLEDDFLDLHQSTGFVEEFVAELGGLLA